MHVQSNNNVTVPSSPGWRRGLTGTAVDIFSPTLPLRAPDENTDCSLPVCVSAGGDGHQPHGVVSSQQPGQLLQPAPR